jgi:hypothetical protein
MQRGLALIAMPMMTSWLPDLLLIPLLGRALGNFVSSLHSNFVVNLDFEGNGDGVEAANPANESKLMAFAGGRQKFKCSLPSSSSRHRPDKGSDPDDDVSKFRAHFRSAKLAPLKGRCWTTRIDYWSYDVCFGRKILQYRPDAETRFSLGEHVPEADVLHPDGHVTESFVGGTDNRSSEIHYVCGNGGEARAFKIEEPQPLRYAITITSAVFCPWREKEGTETRDADGNVLPISALLEDLRENCVNVTQGWWTYEYCFPHSLRQFHVGNGRQRDPEHVLGTINGSGASSDIGKVEMSLVRLKPSISPRERRASPSNHRTLRQFLGGGTVCDETHRPRTTTMHFQCPPNWQSQSETRIVNINEGSLCEYDIMVHTNLLCGHQKLIPALPRGKEVIQCAAQPREL